MLLLGILTRKGVATSGDAAESSRITALHEMLTGDVDFEVLIGVERFIADLTSVVELHEMLFQLFGISKALVCFAILDHTTLALELVGSMVLFHVSVEGGLALVGSSTSLAGHGINLRTHPSGDTKMHSVDVSLQVLRVVSFVQASDVGTRKWVDLVDFHMTVELLLGGEFLSAAFLHALSVGGSVSLHVLRELLFGVAGIGAALDGTGEGGRPSGMSLQLVLFKMAWSRESFVAIFAAIFLLPRQRRRIRCAFGLLLCLQLLFGGQRDGHRSGWRCGMGGNGWCGALVVCMAELVNDSFGNLPSWSYLHQELTCRSNGSPFLWTTRSIEGILAFQGRRHDVQALK